jgi:hypothetical protein
MQSSPQHKMEVSGQVHALATLPLGKVSNDTPQIRGWVGPRASLEVEEIKTAFLKKSRADFIPGMPASIQFLL